MNSIYTSMALRNNAILLWKKINYFASTSSISKTKGTHNTQQLTQTTRFVSNILLRLNLFIFTDTSKVYYKYNNLYNGSATKGICLTGTSFLGIHFFFCFLLSLSKFYSNQILIRTFFLWWLVFFVTHYDRYKWIVGLVWGSTLPPPPIWTRYILPWLWGKTHEQYI